MKFTQMILNKTKTKLFSEKCKFLIEFKPDQLEQNLKYKIKKKKKIYIYKC